MNGEGRVGEEGYTIQPITSPKSICLYWLSPHLLTQGYGGGEQDF